MRRAGALIVLVVLLACAPGALAASGDPLRPRQWGLTMVESDAAHQTATGSGAVVAVIDTGVRADHPDLAGRVLPGFDFVDDDATPQDGNGHGTHVAGIIAAASGNGIGVSSVAPGAKILPIRVLDDNGEGDDAAITHGIDYAVAHGADVINLSLGAGVIATGQPTGYDAAIGRALDRGVIVVAAAGNDSLPVCEQSAASARLLCVGAVDRRRARSYFSSFGLGLGLVAPGGSALPGPDEDILSTYNDGGYAELAGTSQATPHVSGVAALLVSRGVRGQAAVQRILATATDAGLAGPDLLYGAGIVDARRAVAGLSATQGPGGGSRAVRVSVLRVTRIGTVLRHGVRVSCRAPGSGRCRVSVYLRGRRVGAASRALRLGRTSVVTVRLTPRGRAVLRRSRTATLRIRVQLPGAPLITRVLSVSR